MAYQVLIFYKYVTIDNPQEVADQFSVQAENGGLTGRVIVAHEGINATLEGTNKNTEDFVVEFFKDPRFVDIDIKRSKGNGDTFPKLNVRVRNEIVGTRFPLDEADPRVATAPHLSVEELRSWYETNKDFVVVDMRNSYEYASGHFPNAIDPGLESSRDLPQAIEKLKPLKNKTVLTVCTAGVRCEKMSAYLLSKGFENVYQLDGGIHTYMEKYPGQDFLGTLYTFDQRVVMDFGGERQIVGECLLCSTKTERYINCAYPRCNRHFLACESCVAIDQKGYCSDDCRTTHEV